jgi:hypothetical protein
MISTVKRRLGQFFATTSMLLFVAISSLALRGIWRTDVFHHYTYSKLGNEKWEWACRTGEGTISIQFVEFDHYQTYKNKAAFAYECYPHSPTGWRFFLPPAAFKFQSKRETDVPLFGDGLRVNERTPMVGAFRSNGRYFVEGTTTKATISNWILLLLTAILPLRWLVQFYLHRAAGRVGLCPKCGYDLRATPDRCPECGAMPVKR